MSKQSIIIMVAGVGVLALILIFASQGTIGGLGSGTDVPGGGDEPSGPVTREQLPRNVVIVVPSPESENVPENVAVPETISVAGPDRGDASFRSFDISISGDEFKPDTVIVYAGDTVRLNFTAVGKAYDLTQPDYGWKVSLSAGGSKFVQFDATAPGKFTFFCSSCGGPESGPVGYVTIVPKE